MESITALKELYENYDAEATKVRESASWFDGMFGLGNDPRKHYCHDVFYENVKKWTDAFVTGNPAPDAVLSAATWILEAPANHRGADSYWYMYVSIVFIGSMIPLLRKEDCKALAQRLNDLYPRIDRMPVQQDIFKRLTKAGK